MDLSGVALSTLHHHDGEFALCRGCAPANPPAHPPSVLVWMLGVGQIEELIDLPLMSHADSVANLDVKVERTLVARRHTLTVAETAANGGGLAGRISPRY
jgi:hypothetical protein